MLACWGESLATVLLSPQQAFFISWASRTSRKPKARAEVAHCGGWRSDKKPSSRPGLPAPCWIAEQHAARARRRNDFRVGRRWLCQCSVNLVKTPHRFHERTSTKPNALAEPGAHCGGRATSIAALWNDGIRAALGVVDQRFRMAVTERDIHDAIMACRRPCWSDRFCRAYCRGATHYVRRRT